MRLVTCVDFAHVTTSSKLYMYVIGDNTFGIYEQATDGG